MFASLRNKFSNYWTCSLRFDIEGNIIIEDFASLRFDNLVICFDVYTIEACAKPEGVYTTGAWAPSGRVCTAEECTAPGGICHRARDASGRVCTAEVCDASGGVYIMEAWAASEPKLWIEKTNDLVDIETNISRNLKGLVAIKIATAVRKKSLAAVETAIWFFKTQPRREWELDR